MSKHIKFAKINSAIKRFENNVNRINSIIDKRSKSGKYNENDDSSYRHFSGTTDDGSRCWSY